MKRRYNESWNKPYKEAFAFMDACLSDGLTLAEGHKLLDKAYAVLNDVPLLDVPKSKAAPKKPVAKHESKLSDNDLKAIKETLSNVTEQLEKL